MIKRFSVLLVIVFAFLCLSGCSLINNLRKPYNDVDPVLPPYFYYSYNEQCTNGDKYLTVRSCEVTTDYKDFADKAKASGYFLVVAVTTNLTDEDFADPENKVVTGFPFRDQPVNMIYLSYEETNDKVVYEFPKLKNFDYGYLRYLKMLDEEITPDTRAISFRFDFKTLNPGRFTIDGTEFSGKSIKVNMKY